VVVGQDLRQHGLIAGGELRDGVGELLPLGRLERLLFGRRTGAGLGQRGVKRACAIAAATSARRAHFPTCDGERPSERVSRWVEARRLFEQLEQRSLGHVVGLVRASRTQRARHELADGWPQRAIGWVDRLTVTIGEAHKERVELNAELWRGGR